MNDQNTKIALDSRKKKFLRFLPKLLVSLGLLVFVYRKVTFSQLTKLISALSTQDIFLLLAIYTFGQIISSIKWRIFVQEAGLKRTLLESLKAYFLGMTMNTFGFGTVGGDVVRGLALKPLKGQRAPALASVVADRIHGLGVLLSIGSIAMIFAPITALGKFAEPLGIISVISLVLFWWIGPKILTTIFHQEHRLGQAAILAANAFPKKLAPFLRATFISTIFHLSQIYMIWIISQSLELNLTFSFLLASVPLINAASSFPFTINGLGIRESAYLFFFSPFHINNEQCAALGAIWILISTVVAALAGFIILFSPSSTLQRSILDQTTENSSMTNSESQRISNL